MYLEEPRGLGQPELLAQRRELLITAPAVQPLRRWIEDWQERRPGAVCPDFDPAEAGVDARVLVLLEAPGPMSHTDNATTRPGTGFISVDNPDQTAANSWAARSASGLDETTALHWNIVPWYLGPASKKPNAAALAAGAKALKSLLPLLPDLQVVLLAGQYAQRGWQRHIEGVPGVTTIDVPHPSPLAMAQPGKREALMAGMHRAKALVG